MASFRRSLIHVDFFIRRKKKKDKRRNTMIEGDTKELKDVLHNIINEKSQCAVETNMKYKKNSNHENNHNIKKFESNKINKILNEEKNNNSSDTSACPVANSRNCIELDTNSEGKDKMNTSKDDVKLDLKNHYNSEITKSSSFTKRKSKGHIPISTVSAAMSVAVEMRQLNSKIKSEDQSSSGNWSYSSDLNSSDSENRRNSGEYNKREVISGINKNNSSLYKENHKNRLKENDAISLISSTKVANKNKEMEISSCTSSENGIDDGTSNATSTESEVFFISSDESDEEISDLIFEPNYGSSTSLTTVSNGSLNSLLSQTGTGMVSSTGTLTSIGLDRLPTPPPPPPTIITATANRHNFTTIDKTTDMLDKSYPIQNQKMLYTKKATSSKKPSKSVQKSSKSLKTEKTDTIKNSAENSKNIFSSLVNMKTRAKDENKLKSPEKANKTINQPLFNMYGSDSPQNIKLLPSFINENVSPVMKIEPKKSLQSFTSCPTQPKLKIKQENIINFSKLEPKVETNMNPSVHNTSINSASGYCPEISNVEVPLKYVHTVTVTPIQRQSLTEQSNSLLTCRKSLFKESEQMILDSDIKQTRNLNTFHLPNSNKNEQCSFEKPKPQRPMTLQPEKPKVAARVLLDPEGRVVHCTNSLDRKLHYVVPTERYTNTGNVTNHTEYTRNQGEEIKEINFYNSNCNQNSSSEPPLNKDMINRRYSVLAGIDRTNYRPDAFEMAQMHRKNHFISQQSYNESLHSHQVIGDNHCHRTNTGFTTQNMYGAQSLPRQRFQVPKNPHIVVTPDPNISGLPINDTLLTKHNVNLHSKHMEKLNMPVSNTTTNSSEPYMSSQKSFKGPVSTAVNKSPTTMSTEDLFAVIHNCKKRMNIKTDSDISLASSSRSNSPSYLRPASAKGALAETGFLSPRNSSSFDSRDRRSWADFRPSNETCGERKSLASDRLGPTKPTSMHDFKMLLLQARSNSQVLGPRKSAVEMLKVPAQYNKDTGFNSMPLNLSPQKPSSHSLPNSPSTEFYLSNGHSTVPFKRNNRARSTLQPRYTMYPPIFEDCSEDSENNRDMLQTAENNIDVHKNPHVQHNESSPCANISQTLRQWV